MLRRLISGLSPEQADKALVEFFREIEICDEVILESDGFYLVSRRRDPPMDECPF